MVGEARRTFRKNRIGFCVLLANMTAEPRDVRVQNLSVNGVQVRHLDERSFDRATGDGAAWSGRGVLHTPWPGETHVPDGGSPQLCLLPYAVARLDDSTARPRAASTETRAEN